MRTTNDFIKVVNMPVFAYHGVLAEEKATGQEFFLNAKVYVDMRTAGLSDHLEDTINYDKICIYLKEVFAEKCFDTIEAAGEYTTEKILADFPSIQAMELEVRKPHAPLTYMPEDISITIYREWHQVYLSFGSNENHPLENIKQAIIMLQEPQAIRNIRQSELFVTKPYGPVEQPDFVNGCLELETYMHPEELVTYIHKIEDAFERDRSIRWGPRPIDLDIVFYDDWNYNSKTLTIPHADMENRMFVLEPLSQLCPYRRHPIWGKTVENLKRELLAKGNDEILERII